MAGRKRGGFAFDLYQPLKKGVLLKQGAVHTAFKYRFFVLYPGFFVYYEKESKWRQDLTKGETLDSRIGAIKLVGGTCNIARGAPKGCKFGFTIHAPDPLNKRPTYLINATSKQDRDEWIEAIRDATPSLGGSKRSMEEPITRPSAVPQPPPYSAGPGRQPYSDPIPPSLEKRQDLGQEFTPASYNKPSPSSWQQHPNESSPRRVPEEPKRPAYPPRPPARQYTPAATPSAGGFEQPKTLESAPTAAVRKTPAASWQQPVPVNVGPPKVPEDARKQQPLKPKPPVRGYPGATPAASVGRGRGDAKPTSATESGDQWIKAIRKSTNTKPAWGTNATSPTKGASVDSGQMEFKKARERLINAMGTSTTSSPPQKQRSTVSPVQIRQEPKKPAPPPPPEHEPTLYVNIDDIENEDDSSSDDDNPAQQPPPYLGPTNGAPRIMTPVNMEALGRHMGAQRFIEKKGYLYKLGTKRKTWNLRYFVLRPGVFTYAKNAQTKVNEVVKLKNLQVYYPGAGERKTSYQFILHTESTWNKKADWTLAAQTESEMKDWILAFKLAGQGTSL